MIFNHCGDGRFNFSWRTSTFKECFKKSQENGINISGSTIGGRKVAKRFTPKFLQIVKGCAMPFFTQSGKVCMPLVLLGKSQLNVPSTGLMQTL